MATNKIRPASKKTNQKSSCINLDLKHQCVKIVHILKYERACTFKIVETKRLFQQKKRFVLTKIKYLK
jgi:hypothetical protein